MIDINTVFKTNIGDFSIIKKLGKGKSGCSYLAELDDKYFVIKSMHNEPCNYYSFGDSNKVLLEVNDYQTLKKCRIPLPTLLSYDAENNYLVKEFIDGEIASWLIAKNQISESIIEQLFEIYHRVKNAKINIDYFPSNFVIRNDRLFYIDYEANPYLPDWDLPNWGIYYWANTDGFRKYLDEGCITLINESLETGVPIKRPFEEKVTTWISRYDSE